MDTIDDNPRLFSLPETRKWCVKLYHLTNESWKEFGLGLLSGRWNEENNEFSIVVNDTRNSSKHLMHSVIKPPVAFQKQDTLLLWHGPEKDIKVERDSEDWIIKDGITRIAIGFELPAACTIMTDFILHAIAEQEKVLTQSDSTPTDIDITVSVYNDLDASDDENNDNLILSGLDDPEQEEHDIVSGTDSIRSGSSSNQYTDASIDKNNEETKKSDKEQSETELAESEKSEDSLEPDDSVQSMDDLDNFEHMDDIPRRGRVRKRVSFAVQHSNQSNEQERFAEVIEEPYKLPQLPTVYNLRHVAQTAAALLNSKLGREFLIVYFDINNYLEKLWSIYVDLCSYHEGHSKSSDEAQEHCTSDCNDDSNKDQELDHEDDPHHQSSKEQKFHTKHKTKSSHKRNVSSPTFPPSEIAEISRLCETSKQKHRQRHSQAQKMSFDERISMLWAVSDIIKIYLMLGDVIIVERMTEASSFYKVLAMLEYDQNYGNRRANLRSYFSKCVKMLDIIKELNPDLNHKIQRPFRMYILLEILTRNTVDDYSYNILKTLVHVSYSDLLKEVCNDPRIFKSIFQTIKGHPENSAHEGDSENTKGEKEDDEGKKEERAQAIRLITEMVKSSRNVNINQSKAFYHCLIYNGLFESFEHSFYESNMHKIKILVLESLTSIADCNMQTVWSFQKPLIKGLIFLLLEDAPRCETYASSKSLQVQAYTLFKKMASEFPNMTMTPLFERMNEILLNPQPSAIIGKQLLAVVQIILFCYVDAPDIVNEIMEKLESWNVLTSANLFNRTDISKHLQSQLAMLVIRLLRTAIISGCQVLGCEEANMLSQVMVESKFIKAVIEHINACKFNTNAEEFSTSLSLFYAILDAYNQKEKSAITIVQYLATDLYHETKDIAEVYKVAETFLDLPNISSTIDLSLSTVDIDTTADTSSNFEVGSKRSVSEMLDDSTAFQKQRQRPNDRERPFHSKETAPEIIVDNLNTLDASLSMNTNTDILHDTNQSDSVHPGTSAHKDEEAK
ncbi:Psy2 protein [Starmerella bacillaris]|uniref:Psy2 protein n=1 Tax=Starmerella bacillaris TaxID=1247836 RepID=A0AAV5RI78_STABA|nr:Psy2 protein [Starmerella bacillaris]